MDSRSDADLDTSAVADQLAKTASNAQLLVISIVLVVLGLALYGIGRATEETPSYQTKSSSLPGGKVVLTLKPHEAPALPGALVDLGLALIPIGAVGVIFERLNRRAANRVLQLVIQRTTAELGIKVAKQATETVLGDSTFVTNVLRPGEREALLRQFVLANINSTDRSASYLADKTAAQFSGSTRLEDYEVRYTLYPGDDDHGGREHARFEQRFRSNLKPDSIFKFRFLVLSEADDEEASVDESVFTWRYWRDPQKESIDDALALFGISKLTVNGEHLEPLVEADLLESERIPESPHERRLYFRFSGRDAKEYEQIAAIDMPSPRVGRYVYFEPNKLAHGMNVSCAYHGVNKAVTTIENLGAPYVRYEKDDGLEVVRTSSWVAPTASVAFVIVDDQGSDGVRPDTST